MRKGLLLLLCLVVVPVFAATHVELFNSGKALLEKGEHEKAAAMFEKAIEANPKIADYHFHLGAAYGNWAMRANIIKQASLARKTKAAFEKAVQLDPRHFEAHFGLITFYMQAPGIVGGGEDKAFAQAATVKKLDVLAGHRAYARIYVGQQKFDKAREEFVAAVRAMPTNARAHYYLGNAYGNEKNFTAALHEYEQALKLDAAFMPAYFRIGWLAAESGAHFARGEESLKKYLGYKPAEGEPGLASAWYYLGSLYEKQGRKADAKNAYLQAKKLAPDAKDVTDALKRVS
jgi:tetratricopeptide (TPR) repeat protein